MTKKNWTDDRLLAQLLNSKSGKSRWDTIRILRSRPSKALFLQCERLIKSKEKKNRIIGIDILAQLGIPPRQFLKQTLKIYFNLLTTETDPTVLMAVLISIGHNNEKLTQQQIRILCSFSNSDNKLIKEGLVSALGFVDNSNATDVLIKLSHDKSHQIRNWATFYIGEGNRNNKKIREALWQRVNDKHQETKLEAILGLAKRKDPNINEIIKRELTEGEYGILLFEAILETCDKQFLPILKKHLKSAKADTNINPKWLSNLKDCMKKLTEITN